MVDAVVPRRRRAWRITVAGVVRVAVIAVTVILTIGPVAYAFLLSLRPLTQVVQQPLALLPWQTTYQLDAFLLALRPTSSGGFGLGQFMMNSLVLAGSATAATLAVSVLGAYAVARLKFPGRSAFGGVFLATYVFPGIVLAVPLFVLFSTLGLRGHVVSLVVIYMAFTVPVAVYMLRNYFLSVPQSIEEAAMIDGCGRLGVIFRVVLPTTAPGIAATGLYVFMIAWNEFLFALLFLVNSRHRWTVSLGLQQLNDVGVPITVLIAGSLLVTLPVIGLFFGAQKLLVAGMTSGAEKG